MASETALEIMALTGMAVLVIGIAASLLWTLPTVIRSLRSHAKGTIERTLFRWDLILALVSLSKLVLLAAVVGVILATEPSLIRAQLTRPMLLVVLCLVAFTAVLTPLRDKAIERTARQETDSRATGSRTGRE